MSTNTSSQHDVKILIVDDNPKNIIAMKNILSDLPIEIHTAESGDDALRCLIRHMYAVIYLDVQMPGMDGYEVAKHISENKETSNTPIVFVTAIDDNKKNIREGYASGAIDYLTKPIDPNILISKTKIFAKLFQQQTELTEAIYKLDELANKDSLTGLANRNYFNDTLKKTLSDAKRHNTEFAIIFLDLDEFKSINDNLGHNIGDLLLQNVSQRLSTTLRDSDFIARLGGDEFVIILSNIESKTLPAKVAKKIIATLSDPIIINNHQLNISCSIGIATYPIGSTTITGLMKAADIALYRSKITGKNTYNYFNEALNAIAIRKLKIESALRQAITKDSLYFLFQPRVDIKTLDIIGIECLARWSDADFHNVSPTEFISIAEEFGFINKLGDYLLNKAFENCKHLSSLNTERSYQFSINLSPYQFLTHDFISYVKHLVSKHQIDVNSIEFELTESIFKRTDKELENLLSQLSHLGFKFSIDDFGTGYSSLSRLKTLPIDILKIDKSFVRDILNDPNDVAIIEAIIALSKALKLTVVAEGVESHAQSLALLDRECLYAQGFYYSKPVNLDKITTLLKLGKITLDE